MKKRLGFLLLAVALVATSLAGCGGDQISQQPEETTATVETQATESEEAAKEDEGNI